jgi:3-dehydroquinate dehydratase/shikimate dehydrogenase
LHNIDEKLIEKIKSMQNIGNEIPKITIAPQSLSELIRVYQAAGAVTGTEKIILCYGEYGINTQILSDQLGSLICYTNVNNEDYGIQASPGLLDPSELEETYRFSSITKNTKKFIVADVSQKSTVGPRFFNKVFDIEKTDAVYFPLSLKEQSTPQSWSIDTFDSLIKLAESIKAAGIAVTYPYKETALSFISHQSDEVEAIGACDTMKFVDSEWVGFKADARGIAESILTFSGFKNLKGKKITIIGAGGAARAVVEVVSELKGKALILNRTVIKARSLAMRYGFSWGGLDSQGFEMMRKFSDIIIQATSLGMDDESDADLLDFYQFTGKELVIDLICSDKKTNCLRRAEDAGCKTLDGYYILLRKARYQYEYFLDEEFPPSLVDRVGLQD